MSIKLNDKTIKAAKAGAKVREVTIAGHPNLVVKHRHPASGGVPCCLFVCRVDLVADIAGQCEDSF